MPGEAEPELQRGRLSQGSLAPGSPLQVNDQKMDTPFNPNKQLQVTIRSNRLHLITDFEFTVSFDGKSNAGT